MQQIMRILKYAGWRKKLFHWALWGKLSQLYIDLLFCSLTNLLDTTTVLRL